jgi:hypothetical protein
VLCAAIKTGVVNPLLASSGLVSGLVSLATCIRSGAAESVLKSVCNIAFPNIGVYTSACNIGERSLGIAAQTTRFSELHSVPKRMRYYQIVARSVLIGERANRETRARGDASASV